MRGDIVERRNVGGDTLAAMYELFVQQFCSVSLQQFTRDFEEKNWVLLLRHDDGALFGFSCMHVYDVSIGGRSLTIIYSGDTVVEGHHRSESALSYNWMGAVDYLRRMYTGDTLYWLLLVSGYRTYRFLPVYSRSFYPRFDQPTPADVQAIMDALARKRFGERYDPLTGIVRLAVPAILCDELRGIPKHRLSDPHIAFFSNRNPGHEHGDELVCLSSLSEDTLTRGGRRMWVKGRDLFPDGPIREA